MQEMFIQALSASEGINIQALSASEGIGGGARHPFHRSPGLRSGASVGGEPAHQGFGMFFYRRASGCFSGSQAPSALLDATDCSMKYIPSTPS